jgi:hypothetical protein
MDIKKDHRGSSEHIEYQANDLEIKQGGTGARLSEHQAVVDSFTDAEKKKIVRHVDRRLVLTLGVLYAVSLMDRTNLGAAAIAGQV